jgi:hypothetical protein
VTADARRQRHDELCSLPERRSIASSETIPAFGAGNPGLSLVRIEDDKLVEYWLADV